MERQEAGMNSSSAGVLRVLPFLTADGPTQMAVDDWMLEAALRGEHLFRLYGWEPATLSLGYFQSHRERLRQASWARLPWVRRATGGGAILHGEDLTYAIALPPATARQRRHADWHCELHRLLNRELQAAGLATHVCAGNRPGPAQLDFLCFTVPQPGDIVLGSRKLVGGAARVCHGALLQHGSIYGEAIKPLKATLPRVVAEWLGLTLQERPWTAEEWQQVLRVADGKFRQSTWNERR
jgi:lipoate-protein ligase A